MIAHFVAGRTRLSRALGAVLLAATLPGLAACTLPGLIIGAGAAGGVAASQERGLETAIDDNGIVLDINRRLIAEDSKLFERVSTEVSEGRVLLTGNVPTPEARIAVARIAWAAPGVREVNNEVRVKDDAGLDDYAKDVWISTKLRTRLLADSKVSAINYSIETVNRTIYLLGIAQSAAELERVKGHARDIEGVRNVVSYVVLKDDPSRPQKP